MYLYALITLGFHPDMVSHQLRPKIYQHIFAVFNILKAKGLPLVSGIFISGAIVPSCGLAYTPQSLIVLLYQAIALGG
jgi:hypothetical protein